MHELDRDEMKINCLGKKFLILSQFAFTKVIQFCAKLNKEFSRGIIKIKLLASIFFLCYFS